MLTSLLQTSRLFSNTAPEVVLFRCMYGKKNTAFEAAIFTAIVFKHYKGRYFILISKQKAIFFYIFFAPIYKRGNELHGTSATADGVQLLGAVILRGGRRSSSVAFLGGWSGRLDPGATGRPSGRLRCVQGVTMCRASDIRRFVGVRGFVGTFADSRKFVGICSRVRGNSWIRPTSWRFVQLRGRVRGFVCELGRRGDALKPRGFVNLNSRWFFVLRGVGVPWRRASRFTTPLFRSVELTICVTSCHKTATFRPRMQCRGCDALKPRGLLTSTVGAMFRY